jgi:phenylpropionate dioxygenase-like ring-hydroxylating dioxygenase large terminal subunit
VECKVSEQPAGLDYGSLIREDRVQTSLYVDPAIFEAEMHKIFGSTWVWVAHASEIPTAGSFKMSHVGRQPVIVTRGQDGGVHVLLNRCRHRASSVCEDRKGKARLFVCRYHGWSYDITGKLRGVPLAEGYGPDFDKNDYSLVSLRVEEYAGLIFATFRKDIEPLYDYLAGARKWIDLFMKQGAGFEINAASAQRFRFRGNWKIQLENTTDAYHFPIVHRSFLSSLDDETEDLFDVFRHKGWVEDLGNGHSVMVMIPDLVDLDANLEAPIPERFRALADELAAEYPPETVRRIVRAVGGTGFLVNLFPNVACSMAFFRVLRPIAVDETEITHMVIQMEGGPPAANRARLRLHEHFQGPMGFGTTDDAEAWERVQRGAAAGEDLWIMLNRGKSHGVTAETGMRAAYDMWKRMMTS